MSTMYADGTITDTPRCLEGPSCCGAVFHIRATYSQLTEVLGETDTIPEAEPTWVILVRSGDDRPNERVRIHHTSNSPRESADVPTLWYVTAYPEGRWAAERLGETLGEIVEFTY